MADTTSTDEQVLDLRAKIADLRRQISDLRLQLADLEAMAIATAVL